MANTPVMPDQLDDFLNTTVESYEKGSWVDISLEHQEYTFAEQYGSKEPPSKGGQQITWDLQVKNLDNARWTELYSVDVTRQKNIIQQASQQWAKATANYIIDVDEIDLQRDGEEIISLVDAREHSMYNDAFELFEEGLWGSPASSTENPRKMSGIPFWIQKNATKGFSGGNPSGFTSGAGGLDADTYLRWKNYSNTYATVNRDDLVDSWIEAANFCQFKAPHSYKQLDGASPRWQFHTTFRALKPMWQFLDTRNDNLTDLAGMAADDAKFMGIPVRVAWVLENTSGVTDTSDPIYGCDWSTMELYGKRGGFMRTTPFKEAPNQHTVRERHMDTFLNICCKNRRRNFVLYKT